VQSGKKKKLEGVEGPKHGLASGARGLGNRKKAKNSGRIRRNWMTVSKHAGWTIVERRDQWRPKYGLESETSRLKNLVKIESWHYDVLNLDLYSENKATVKFCNRFGKIKRKKQR